VLEATLIYALFTWFFFFLFNYAEITSKPSTWAKGFLGAKLGYPLGCALCFSFWTTLGLWLIFPIPFLLVPTVAVSTLFIDLAYTKLSAS